MAIVQDTEVLTTSAPRGRMTMSRREAAWGLLFLSPWFIGLALFYAIPIIVSFVMSFTDFNPVNAGAVKFVGLANYQWMFSESATVSSFFITLKLSVIGVPLGLFAALGLAIMLNQKLLAGKRVFRTLFFMPVQIPLVASTIVWLDFLNGSNGWLAYILNSIQDIFITFFGGLLNVSHPYTPIAPSWFQDTAWAVPGLILMGLWGIGNAMLIFLAGLQTVPTELYEAARVDGAGRWQQFRNVTLPMISPVFFYNLLIAVIGMAQYFTQPYVIGGSSGNPGGETLVFNINLYNEAWKYNFMGHGAALAWLMFVVVLGFSIVLFRTSARWVFYAGGDR
jgi:multiple sugar transport system permease protein